MMQLEAIDAALLDGAYGAAAAHAMRLLVQYGEAMEAEHFISIESAHIDGCLYHGPSSTDFVRRFVELGGRVRVPTTLNVAAVDVIHPGWFQGPPELIPAQCELTALHEELGCLATLTCAPYQRMFRPSEGQHVAWAESNAIVFVNSVLGARTDRYGDFTDLCAALTGRVPLAGLHIDANRLATVEFSARALGEEMADDEFWACLGYVVGERAKGRVPVITGLSREPGEDDLKALGAAAATSGALAHFHIVGVTPEARSLSAVTAGVDVERVALAPADLLDARSRLNPLAVGEPVAAMCLGTPHFSLQEFRRLAEIVRGRRIAVDVQAFVSTSREIAAQVEADPELACLFDFGIAIIVDTCTYLAPVVRDGTAAIVTNSAKWAHYAPGNIGRRAGMMSIERCVRSAELGSIAP